MCVFVWDESGGIKVFFIFNNFYGKVIKNSC